jgi:DNA-binding CsgD family transcriptional regulator
LDHGSRHLRTAVVLFMALVATGGLVDLVLDWPSGPSLAHVVFELGVVGLSLSGLVYLGVGWQRERGELARIRRAIDAHRTERDRWRARAEKLLRGLGEAIDAQLEEWKLTPAERQVALLLLKGFGHKEIAELQQRSERTVRQHAVAVYRKSGLGGRAELAAFFLEDLMLPTMDAPDEPDAGRASSERSDHAGGA